MEMFRYRPSESLTGHEFTGVVHSLGAGVETDSLRRAIERRRSRGVSVLQSLQPMLLVRSR